ncbi:Fasciclin-domain-containing protein [Aaosphaeria arxii CBS 175.79]|uniref:Fasciclin-domain-containing protein n=1 Tax=Aaosphaeria arxii CBS 175.79 TaxID=1450172 RepID=A0A6A5Y0H9_9PLEO|nr:Fasciclin-domain-containing protein [Aaosphaeria arxii CBS 175.79]KAF2018587.1 Fasciclin-domain-containing protein [Aaosphaeria arxii CBS 175.79]
MRVSLWSLAAMAGACMAQGDIAALLASQEDLSTLLELVGLVPGLADTLAAASNITIVAPTNEAFAKVPRNIPEGEAIEQKNDTVAIGALLANHVFKGVYPSDVITDVPTFAQTLLDISYIIDRQPFSNFTGGAYNGLVKNGDDVCIISGEQTISTVTEANIKLGEGITIHKIDTVLSFGAPFQLFTFRGGYLNMNAALEAAHLNFAFGETGADVQGLNISDYTIFVPTDEAFENIGSILASANLETLQSVLSYHIIPNNVIFSPSLGNVTVPSLQGEDLTITVLPDGSAWVNNARIVFPNNILYNGVAHVIDNVIAPGSFDRASLKPSAPASERLAFPSATPVASLPFSSISFATDLMAYTTTPELLKTVAAIATPTGNAGAATTTSSGVTEFTGSANAVLPGAVAAVVGAFGVAGALI